MLTKSSKTLSSRVVLSMLAAASFACADTIDLSSGNTFTLTHGQQLTLRFSVWNYGANNVGSSPYPTSLGLELIGSQPGSSLAAVPGSNASFYTGYLLQGTLESLDGAASVPLESQAAASMGLADGFLLLTPGMYYGSGASTPATTIEADAAFSMNMSEQIFGPNVANRQSSALIVLQNLGSDLVIGLGNGTSLRGAFAEPSVTGLGGVQTSGITQSVTVSPAVGLVQAVSVVQPMSVVPTSVPEPSTLTVVLLLGVLSAGWLLLRRRLRN